MEALKQITIQVATCTAVGQTRVIYESVMNSPNQYVVTAVPSVKTPIPKLIMRKISCVPSPKCLVIYAGSLNTCKLRISINITSNNSMWPKMHNQSVLRYLIIHELLKLQISLLEGLSILLKVYRCKLGTNWLDFSTWIYCVANPTNYKLYSSPTILIQPTHYMQCMKCCECNQIIPFFLLYTPILISLSELIMFHISAVILDFLYFKFSF